MDGARPYSRATPIRFIHQKSTCPNAIDLEALCGANLVTCPLEAKETFVVHKWKGLFIHLSLGPSVSLYVLVSTPVSVSVHVSASVCVSSPGHLFLSLLSLSLHPSYLLSILLFTCLSLSFHLALFLPLATPPRLALLRSLPLNFFPSLCSNLSLSLREFQSVPPPVHDR